MNSIGEYHFAYDPAEQTVLALQTNFDAAIKEAKNYGQGQALAKAVIGFVPVDGIEANPDAARDAMALGCNVAVLALRNTVHDLSFRENIVNRAKRLSCPAPDIVGVIDVVTALNRKRSLLEEIADKTTIRHQETRVAIRLAQSEHRRRNKLEGISRFVRLGAGLTLHQIDTAWGRIIDETTAIELVNLDFESLLPPLEDV